MIYRDPKVRMYYGWYTTFIFIRTFGEGFQRIALIAFHVIDNKFQMIVEQINDVNKGFDDMPAEKRIPAVALGELTEEEDHPVAVHKLGLRKAESITGDAEVFGGGFQVLQLLHGGVNLYFSRKLIVF